MTNSPTRRSKWKWWWVGAVHPNRPQRPIRLGSIEVNRPYLIFQKRSDRRRRQFFPAVQEFQLNQENRFHQLTAHFFEKSGTSRTPARSFWITSGFTKAMLAGRRVSGQRRRGSCLKNILGKQRCSRTLIFKSRIH